MPQTQQNANQIQGYRQLPKEEVDTINEVKMLEQQVRKQILLIKQEGADARWTSIAQTHFDEGFMALVCSIAKPE